MVSEIQTFELEIEWNSDDKDRMDLFEFVWKFERFVLKRPKTANHDDGHEGNIYCRLLLRMLTNLLIAHYAFRKFFICPLGISGHV